MTTALFSAGAGLLPVGVQSGASITFTWGTDIREAWSGIEQRNSYRSKPQQRYDFPVLLSDAEGRDTLGLLARYAHLGSLFRVGLPYEALTVVSSTSTTIAVSALTYCDWAVAGQRVLVIAPSGTTGETIVASAAGSTITVDDNLTAIAVEGARVMPLMPVYLERSQGFARHRTTIGTVDIAALASIAKLGAGTVGTGASLTSFDGLTVWDRGVRVSGTVQQPLDSGATLITAGLRVGAMARRSTAAWRRALAFESHRRADWQWFKLFLDTVRGAWKAFLLPTGRPDLVPVGDASSGTLTITESVTDYVADWWPSLAHRRVAIVLADGTVAYREVTAAVDNGATQALTLSASVAGAVNHVEFLELVRLAADEVRVTWDGHVFRSQLEAVVVQQ